MEQHLNEGALKNSIKQIPVVFVNNVDTYSGWNISHFLANSRINGTLSDNTSVDRQVSYESQLQTTDDQGLVYQVYGTKTKFDSKSKEDELGCSTEPLGMLNLDISHCKQILVNEEREKLLALLLECNIIIYDITDIEDPDQVEEALWALSTLHSTAESFTSRKIFILVSTILTWARTKPLDPENPQSPLTEEEYKRRRAHPAFKRHLTAEKEIIRLGKTKKSKMVMYVVTSGITYGGGEGFLHYWFKCGWHNNPVIQYPGDGQNIVPMIHIKDLASILQNVIERKPSIRYIIAVDEGFNTLDNIFKAISLELTTGEVIGVPKEYFLSVEDIPNKALDMLEVNIHVQPEIVEEDMSVTWVSKDGFTQNIKTCVQEYKEKRGLQPIRLCVLGPPVSGKTTIVNSLCAHYKLHPIQTEKIVQEMLEDLKEKAAEEVTDSNNEEVENAKEQLQDILSGQLANNGEIPNQYVIMFVRKMINSKPCQNQGFVLDGFPSTEEQARELFAVVEEAEELEEEESALYKNSIMPSLVINLNASDEFLRERAMNMPQEELEEKQYSEETFLYKLAHYRNLQLDDITAVEYFDEMEIHVVQIDVTANVEEHINDIQTKIIGKPHNYGPSIEELRERYKKKMEEKAKKEKEMAIKQREKEEEEERQRRIREEEWAQWLSQIQREEKRWLEAQSTPLRNYLMEHVIPTVAEGLLECCRLRPDDPVDFLAEYLFKHAMHE